MKHIKSISLTFLTVLIAVPAIAKTTVAMATPEELAAAGLSSSPSEIPGGTVLFDNDIATFSLAYTDEWGTDEDYGIHSNPASSYRLQVADSQVFTLGVSPAGQTNPAFSGYEAGVMSTGSVFKLDVKQTGWITVFTMLFNPDKKYVVFENETHGLPYTLGGSDGEYKINYCLPMVSSGENAGYVDLEGPETEKYFQKLESGYHRPESPYVTAGMEAAPGYGMGFMTFPVKAGNSYYVSGLGTRLLCQGYVFCDDAEEPAVTFLATDDLPEVKFNTRATLTKKAGDDFEYQGIIYTVLDAEAKTVKTKDGYSEGETLIPGNKVEGDVTVPAIVSDGTNEYAVTEIGQLGFSNCLGLTSIALPEGITTIGNGAFYGCADLTSINIPDKVTSILGSVFYGCSSLTSINIPEGVTSLSYKAFYDCSGLTSIALPDGVTVIGDYAFENCSSLSSINIPDGVTEIGYMAFGYCSSLTSITIPNSVTFSKGSVFQGCSNLTSITLPTGLKNIGNGFFVNCSSLTSITIPDGVTEIEGSAFYGCSSLTSINIPNGLTSIDYGTFCRCSSLTSINIPESVTSIGENAFSGCSSLTSITIPAGVALIGAAAFQDMNSNAEITYLAAKPIEAVDNIFSDSFYSSGTLKMPNAMLAVIQDITPWNKFSKIVAKDGSVGFAVDEGDDFEYQGIIYTVLDAEAKTVKTKDGYYENELFVPGNNVTGDVTIPATVSDGTDDYTVTEIGYGAFITCSRLRSINIPETVTEISAYAFDGCTGLTSINLSDGVTLIGSYAFHDCSILTSIKIPETVTSIGQYAFDGCSNLKSINIPNGVITIRDYVFRGCSSLTSINIPEVVTSIGVYAFEGCSNLTSINIPDGVAEISFGAFNACSSLASVSIPVSVISIGETAFQEINSNAEITYLAAKPIEAADNIFGDDTYRSGTLKIPNATLADVQSTAPWNKFSKIEAKDGSAGFGLAVGEDFEYQGIIYTVLDAEAKTVKTKDGYNDSSTGEDIPGNICEGALVVPSKVSDGTYEYSVIEIGALSFCNTAITSASLPENLEKIGKGAFHGCRNLTAINLPEGLTGVSNAAFMDCESLSEVIFPTTLKIIEGEAFRRCGFTSLAIPEGIEKIEYFAFSQNNQLRSLTIPKSLQFIDGFAFSLEPMLTDVTYNATTPVTGYENLFSEESYLNVTLNMPNATLAGVQATTPWNKFSKIVAKDGSLVTATGLTLNVTTTKMGVGETTFLEVTVLPEDATDKTVTWRSDNEDVATVDADGKVTAVAVGEAIITAKVGDKTAECVITVKAIWNYTVRNNVNDEERTGTCLEGESTSVPYSRYIIAADGTVWVKQPIDKQYNYTFTPDSDNCEELIEYTVTEMTDGIYFVEGEAIEGMTEATRVNAEVRCSNAAGGYADGAIEVCTLKPGFYKVAMGVWGSPGATFNVMAGEETVISAETAGYWYEAVTEDGFTIEAETAITFEGATSSKPLDYILITGTESLVPDVIEVDDISLERTEAVMTVGQTLGLVATVLPENATDKTITWESDNPGVAAVDSYGRVTAISFGEAIITAKSGSVSASCTVTVVPTPVEGITLNRTSLNLVEGGTETLTATVDPSDATDKTVTWTTSDASVATVSASGVVTAVKEGRATITATTSNGKTATCTVTVAIGNGGVFEYGGLSYTVTDAEERTVKTSDGSADHSGNRAEGNLVIPDIVSLGGYEYTVTEIGEYGFRGNPDLLSVTVPGSVTSIGENAFYGCERLTSIVWQGTYPFPLEVFNSVENPNLLIYVNDPAYAPEGLDRNVVANGNCENLILTPGYPFTPLTEFTSEHSEITKSFTQQTPIGGSAGWETLAIPFEPASVTASDGRALVPFAQLSDIETQCPFWLYEADANGEWKQASGIHQGVPYILSMPNNDEYDPQYRIDGDVTFVTDKKTVIAPEACAPHAVTWASGSEFRSLWLPLTEAEAATAMGLNVGISGLTDDEGHVLLSGSAFHTGVRPKPLEAYVTRIDARRAMPVRGGQSFVRMMSAAEGLRIAVDLGEIILSSDKDRTVDVFTPEGVAIRHAELKAGQTCRLDGLTRGIYIVAGRKITVK